jgi:hypothetical protein
MVMRGKIEESKAPTARRSGRTRFDGSGLAGDGRFLDIGIG